MLGRKISVTLVMEWRYRLELAANCEMVTQGADS